MNPFMVINRSLVGSALNDHSQTIELVRSAYMHYSEGRAICPNSVFLRFPWGGKDRVIGLPAYIPEPERAGFKWIASFPENRTRNMERASAVIILNDTETGMPLACLEGALISAYRTAAFAALAAHTLSNSAVKSVGICGTSFIAANTMQHLVGSGFNFDSVHLYDTNPAQVEKFAQAMSEYSQAKAIAHDSADAALRESELFIFATDAIEPHLTDVETLAHKPLVLHISLRDLGNDLVTAAQNVSDSTEHALKEGTSMGNAYTALGADQVEIHSLYEFLTIPAQASPATDKPIIFAPFGLGILDIALAEHVYQQALKQPDKALVVEDFFA